MFPDLHKINTGEQKTKRLYDIENLNILSCFLQTFATTLSENCKVMFGFGSYFSTEATIASASVDSFWKICRTFSADFHEFMSFCQF